MIITTKFWQIKQFHWLILFISPLLIADNLSGTEQRFQHLKKQKAREQRIECHKHPRVSEIIQNKKMVNKIINVNPCAKQIYIRNVRVINTQKRHNDQQATLINAECGLANTSVNIDHSQVYNQGVISSQNTASLINVRHCSQLNINHSHLENRGRIETFSLPFVPY